MEANIGWWLVKLSPNCHHIVIVPQVPLDTKTPRRRGGHHRHHGSSYYRPSYSSNYHGYNNYNSYNNYRPNTPIRDLLPLKVGSFGSVFIQAPALALWQRQFVIWTNTFCNLNKYILQFEQILASHLLSCKRQQNTIHSSVAPPCIARLDLANCTLFQLFSSSH